jgi:hypothetical protein
VVGELGHLGAWSWVAFGAHRGRPAPGVADGFGDRGVDMDVGTGDDREADVAGPAVPHEAGAARRVGADLDRPAHQGRVVVWAVPHRDLFGQPGDRRVEDGDVIGDVVGPRVAGPQQHPESLASGIREAVERMEPVTALVVGRRCLLVLRVHLMQRRVDVEHHHLGSRRGRAAPPDLGTGLRHRLPQARQRGRADLTERPTQRRVRRHEPEQAALGAQHLDIRACLTTPGKHQHRLGQHLAPIVDREPLPYRSDPRGQRIPQTKPVSERSQGVQTDMGHHPVAARLDPDPPRAVTVHPSGALPAGHPRCFATPRMARRALSRPGDLTSSHAP